MRLSLVGLSHRVAPVELRERVSVPPARAAELARELGDAVCLSTCYRTELYLANEEVDRAVSTLEELAREPLSSVVYRLHDEAAAVHLFRVAAGLDSLVPGEGEILGQVRAAYDAAHPGPLLDRVFRQALQIGKRVRTETPIAESPASVPAAAAALAQQVFGDLRGRRVLLVGAGRMGEAAAANLSTRGATIAYVANRSGATRLADRFGATSIRLDAIAGALGDVDVVLASTSAPGAVVHASDVPAHHRKPLFFVDIAVPRDVEPAVQELDGCYLYDVDDLEAVVAQTMSGRREAAARAEELVAEEAERFREWHASLDVVPAIASLRARAEEIRSAELAKLAGLTDRERRTVESVTAQVVNKLLHLPTVRMKEAAAATDGAAYADVVRHLFGLDED
ncbi:MAG: glutamyl-tRNA reductase [Actinobacteria bacterium]|nr:glutamyl-tRNA reductase [Actinomycetota bacterium]MBV8395763.1 glutamyl-tRNA reductase [Actinomycetota bacterium]MBV8598189.1 glutamyl-tRNA reductase [Actinomycetota bacterium]